MGAIWALSPSEGVDASSREALQLLGGHLNPRLVLLLLCWLSYDDLPYLGATLLQSVVRGPGPILPILLFVVFVVPLLLFCCFPRLQVWGEEGSGMLATAGTSGRDELQRGIVVPLL